MDVVRSFWPLMLPEIPNCAVLTAIDFECFQHSGAFKVTKKVADLHIVSREKAHLQSDRLPLKDALVVSFDA